MTGTSDAFGLLLKQLRRQARLTQEELAERTGYSVGYIGMLERGVRVPPPETVRFLARKLDLPDADERRLERAIDDDRRGRSPPSAGQDVGRHTLPVPPTALLGRENDLKRLSALLAQDGARLLTLTGPGGVGKSRLALEVARRLEDRSPDDVVFVELAPITDAGAVVYALAQALGVRDPSSTSLEASLTTRLGEREFLMLLDNFEHVLEAAPLLSRLLAATPSLQLLVTSRSPLRLRGEREYAVSPLAMPPPDADSSVVELHAWPAVQLFIERATAVRHDLAPDEDDVRAVAEICRRLDGLPLAIELAAARIRHFPAPVLLERLAATADMEPSPLRLLTGGAQDLPPRLQTLQGAIDWSYTLLGDAERRLFAHLSVFAGGWTLEAAQAVGAIAPDDVLDRLSHLVDQSLVVAEARGRGTVRYRMLEPIRQYARERLTESGEPDEILRRHAAFYVHLGEAAEPEMIGPNQAFWLDRLEAEIDNIRAALVWARGESGDPEIGLKLATHFSRLLVHRGDIREAREWLGVMLMRAPKADATVRAKALQRVGVLAINAMDHTAAMSSLEEALGIFRSLEDDAGVAWTVHYLTGALRNTGDTMRRKALREESLALARKVGDRRLIAIGVSDLAVMADDVDDLDRAATFGEEALAMNREVGNLQGAGIACYNLSVVERKRGNLKRAFERCAEALSLFLPLGERRMISTTLAGFGAIAHAQGQDDRAVRLFAAFSAIAEECGFVPNPIFLDVVNRGLAEARQSLGDAAFEDAWNAGQRMSFEDARMYALQPGAPAGS